MSFKEIQDKKTAQNKKKNIRDENGNACSFVCSRSQPSLAQLDVLYQQLKSKYGNAMAHTKRKK